MNYPSEHFDLVVNIKMGDSKSFELLFRRVYPKLCAYAHKFLNDSAQAEEIVQELFCTLWKNRDRLDENKSLYSYLFISTKNSCLNFLSASRNRKQSIDLLKYLYVHEQVDPINSYHILLAEDLEKDFNKALEDLPSECRRIFELSRVEGLKYSEIAHQLKISIKTVETQMSRALSKLRLQLRSHIALVLITVMYF